jgi:SP family arabinose:H+ symporter-like MFS transporter
MTTQSNPNPATNDSGSLMFLFFCCFASALGGLLFGYDLFVIAGAKDLIVQRFQLSTLMEGWFVSSAMVGAMLGCMMAGTASDRLGRQKVLVAASFFLLACSVGCGLAWSPASLIFFRWIGGVGVGIASMVCPLYISEISPPRLRGRMVTLFQLAICVGIVAAILINTGLLAWHDRIKGGGTDGVIGFMVDREVWRGMLGMESLPALLFFVAAIIIPESPRWLAEKGLSAKALVVLERINGPQIAAAELADIEATMVEETGLLGELFKPGLRQVLFMALFLSVVSEFSGITTIWNFGPEIIRSQGIQLTNEMSGMVFIASCCRFSPWWRSG